MSDLKTLFIGGGNMAKAIIAGLIAAKYNPKNIFVVDRNADKRLRLTQEYGIQAQENWGNTLNNIDVIVLAIKPQSAEKICYLLAPLINSRPILIISIMAGITTFTLESWLGSQLSIIRAMPNTPAFIQASATGLFANKNTSLENKQYVEKCMSAIGQIAWLEHESDINTITALSGSGPAYFYYFMECMQTTAIKMGLTPEIARKFTLQTAYGAAKLALESGLNIETLRANVTSKGGTTQAALESMQENKMDEMIENAMLAAQQKGIEFSHHFEETVPARLDTDILKSE